MNSIKSKDAAKLLAAATVFAVVLCGCAVAVSEDADAAGYTYTVDGTGDGDNYTSLQSLFGSVKSFSSGTTVAVSTQDSLTAEMVSELSGTESNVAIYVVEGGSLTVTLSEGLGVSEYHVMGVGSGCGLTLNDKGDAPLFSAVDGCTQHNSGDDLTVSVSGASVTSIGGDFHGDIVIATGLSIGNLDMSGCGECGLSITAGVTVYLNGSTFKTSSSSEKNSNAGSISLSFGGTISISSGGTFENSGTISLDGGETVTFIIGDGTLVNEEGGTVSIGSGGMEGAVVRATIVNSGTITLVSGDVLGTITGALYMSGTGTVSSNYSGDIYVQAGDTWTVTDDTYSGGVTSNNITVEDDGTLVIDGNEFSIGDGKAVTVSSGGTLVLTEGTTLYVISLTDGEGAELNPEELSIADGAAIVVDSSKSAGSLVLADGLDSIGDGSSSGGGETGDEGSDTGDDGTDDRSKGGTGGSAEPVYSFAVYYDANGGTDAPATQRITSSSSSATIMLSSAVPTRSGYTFLGWSADPDATSAEYSAGGSVTLVGDGSFSTSVTLYAVWAAGSASGSGSGSGSGSSGSGSDGTGSGSGSGSSEGGSEDDGSGSDWWFWLLIVLIIIILVSFSAWRGYEDRKKY